MPDRRGPCQVRSPLARCSRSLCSFWLPPSPLLRPRSRASSRDASGAVLPGCHGRGGQPGPDRKDQNCCDRARRTVPHRRSAARRRTRSPSRWPASARSSERRWSCPARSPRRLMPTCALAASRRRSRSLETRPWSMSKASSGSGCLDKEIIDTLPTGRTTHQRRRADSRA